MNKTNKLILAGLLTAVLAGSGLAALHNGFAAAAAAGADGAAAQSSAAAGADGPAATPQAAPDDRPCGKGDPAGKPRNNPRSKPDAGAPGGAPAAGSASAVTTSTTVNAGYTVTLSGGFETDPRDHGRPVVLIAAALGVPAEVFRDAFSGVTPAGLDSGGPTGEQAQANKAALMKVLEPYGITNDRLDEVSNYYRYNARKDATWSKTLAVATAKVADGKLTGIAITNPGAGYSSAPTVTVEGPDGTTVTAKATVAYTKDLATNGSLSAIALN